MQKALEPQEIQTMQTLIEQASNKREDLAPADRRREDLLRNFKYLQRIEYGCMESICQVLAYKYYYRPRSVYQLINRHLDKVQSNTFEESPINVMELLEISQKLKTPDWMDGVKRRHDEIRATFRKWQTLGNQRFLCRILAHKYYYNPDSVRDILKG